MSQTSIDSKMPIAVPGLLADNTMSKDAMSAFNAEASAEIPFGVMVAHGTADDDAKLLAATTDHLMGVSVFGHHYDRPLELGDTGLKPKTHFDVLRKGRIYVLVEEPVTPASAVFVRAVATGDEVAGAFRDTADGTDTIDISKFARFVTSAGTGELAVVEIDMTNAKA
jgi:hypothetical protein